MISSLRTRVYKRLGYDTGGSGRVELEIDVPVEASDKVFSHVHAFISQSSCHLTEFAFENTE